VPQLRGKVWDEAHEAFRPLPRDGRSRPPIGAGPVRSTAAITVADDAIIAGLTRVDQAALAEEAAGA
jgi:hypothetical protein